MTASQSENQAYWPGFANPCLVYYHYMCMHLTWWIITKQAKH